MHAKPLLVNTKYASKADANDAYYARVFRNRLAVLDARVLAQQVMIAAARREKVAATRDNITSPEVRLKLLGQRRAAIELEGLTHKQLDEFRLLKLIRVPAPAVEWIVRAVLTLLALNPAPTAMSSMLPWSAARTLLSRPDLIKALQGFDSTLPLQAPVLLGILRSKMDRRALAPDRPRSPEEGDGPAVAAEPALPTAEKVAASGRQLAAAYMAQAGMKFRAAAVVAEDTKQRVDAMLRERTSEGSGASGRIRTTLP
jgi:hypothetical protein